MLSVEELIHISAAQYLKGNLNSSFAAIKQAMDLQPSWLQLADIIQRMPLSRTMPTAWSNYIGYRMSTRPIPNALAPLMLRAA